MQDNTSKWGRKRPLLAAVVLAIAMLTACGAPEPRRAGVVSAPAAAQGAAEQASAPAGPTLGSQRADDMLVWLSSQPARPVRGTAKLDAYLMGNDGQPITDATVTFDTDMRNMSHGPNLVTATPADEGHYEGAVHFLMPGPWRVIVIVERPGHATASLRFEFTVNSK